MLTGIKKRLLISITGIIIIFCVLPFFLKSGFKVQYSSKIKGAKSEVYKVIADFYTWKEWDYWERFDSYAQWTTSNKERKWASHNKRVSSGVMVVDSSVINNSIVWKVVLPNDRLEWYPKVNLSEIGDSTLVTFRLNDEFSFFGRYRYLYYDFEAEIKGGFRKSLTNLQVFFESKH